MSTQRKVHPDQGPRREAPFRKTKPRSENARSRSADTPRPKARHGWKTLAGVIAAAWAIGLITLLAQCSTS
jgi:hypothetical protein